MSAQACDVARRWRWAAVLFGGWWALARGLVVDAAAAVGLPFLLLWHGRPAMAGAVLGIAHLLLAVSGGRSGAGVAPRLWPLALPVVVIAAALGLGGLAGLVAGFGLGSGR
jgi:hypothetical protein